MKKKISRVVVRVAGGEIIGVDVPPGVKVVVHDFDVFPGETRTVKIEKATGDEYVETVYKHGTTGD